MFPMSIVNIIEVLIHSKCWTYGQYWLIFTEAMLTIQHPSLHLAWAITNISIWVVKPFQQSACNLPSLVSLGIFLWFTQVDAFPLCEKGSFSIMNMMAKCGCIILLSYLMIVSTIIFCLLYIYVLIFFRKYFTLGQL
jgi:hypothetical protein